MNRRRRNASAVRASATAADLNPREASVEEAFAFVRQWYDQAPPEMRQAFSILILGLKLGLDPSSEIVRLVGEDRAARLVQCWRDCRKEVAA